jgi:hypothetical protein
VRLVASATSLPLAPEKLPNVAQIVARDGFVEDDVVLAVNRCVVDFNTGACTIKRTYQLHMRLTDAALTFANGANGPDFDFVVPNGLHYARTPSPLALTWDGTP